MEEEAHPPSVGPWDPVDRINISKVEDFSPPISSGQHLEMTDLRGAEEDQVDPEDQEVQTTTEIPGLMEARGTEMITI